MIFYRTGQSWFPRKLDSLEPGKLVLFICNSTHVLTPWIPRPRVTRSLRLVCKLATAKRLRRPLQDPRPQAQGQQVLWRWATPQEACSGCESSLAAFDRWSTTDRTRFQLLYFFKVYYTLDCLNFKWMDFFFIWLYLLVTTTHNFSLSLL